MAPTDVARFVAKLRGTFTALETLPQPTVAAVEGVALGGGLELAMACDMRVAGADAVFGLPEAGLAIIPGAGGTQRLPRLIGASRAKELVFTTRRVGAEEAERLGMVNAAVAAGEAEARALDMARMMLGCGPVALRAAKVAIDRGLQADQTTGMALEEACYAQVIPTHDRLEALEAFAQKRKPVFKGE